jgi:hypothetical protein
MTALATIIANSFQVYRGVTIERVSDGFIVFKEHFETIEEAKSCVNDAFKSFGKNFKS